MKNLSTNHVFFQGSDALKQTRTHERVNGVASSPADFFDKNVIEIFEKQVEQFPHHTAVVHKDISLTYQQLDIYSNQLSHYLIRKGCGKHLFVPICIERSIQMIVGVLGILKSGSAYVPIDPDYPPDRIEYILEDIQAQFCIGNAQSKSLIEKSKSIEFFDLDTNFAALYSEPQTKANTDIKGNSLAYIIYTSGSTGKPKGVMIEHKGLANLSLTQSAYFGMGPGINTLQFASFGFDASCSEIFTSLVSGGSLMLPQKQDLLSAESFENLVNRHHVHIATLTPSFQVAVRDFLGTITTVISAGEPLNVHVGKYLQAKGIRLINAYGPTETTVCVTMSDNPIQQDQTIVIGKPLSNVCIHIIDEDERLCEIGKAGEICVSGVQVSRGYLNQPGLTSKNFVPNPFAGGSGNAIMYRTGDFGRWLNDGNIEYLGRRDDQVKIRGYRIELGEIENTLQQCVLVKQAVVLVRDDENNNKQIVAYIIPSGSFDKEGIIAHLKTMLPDYMIPSLFFKLDSFPITAHGKIDKKALKVSIYDTGRDYLQPVNSIEDKLLSIWQKALGCKGFGTDENFFDLGGSSLIAMQIVTKAKQEGFELEASDFFSYQTIQEIAGLIKKRQKVKLQSGAAQKLNLKEKNLLTVCFHKKGKKTPFFFMSPGFSVFKELVSYLGEDQPFYFFIPKSYTTVESIAAEYIEHMEKIQPKGPYYLGGYCGFGEVAFEMAQQLTAKGEVVAFVALLEFYFPAAIEDVKYSKRLKFYVHELKSASSSQGVRIVYQFAQRKIRKLQKNISRMIDEILYSLPEKAGYLIGKKKYAVKQYGGKVLLFRAMKRTERISEDPYMGWGEYLKGEVLTYTIEGNHKTMFDKKGAEEISKRLAENVIKRETNLTTIPNNENF